MNTQPNTDPNASNAGTPQYNTQKPFYRRGRMLGGLIVVAVGAVLLASRMGVEFPKWLFHWPMILIVVGLYSGARHKFRNFGWLITVSVGVIFLLHEFVSVSLVYYLWPIVIILIGISIMFKRGPHWSCRRHDNGSNRHTAF